MGFKIHILFERLGILAWLIVFLGLSRGYIWLSVHFLDVLGPYIAPVAVRSPCSAWSVSLAISVWKYLPGFLFSVGCLHVEDFVNEAPFPSERRCCG